MVAKGRALFLVGCASCHGKNAEGIDTVKGGQYGPSLIGVGAAAVDFQVSSGRMPMAQPGAQAPRKRPVFTDDQVADLAAFVQSLGPGPDVPNPSEYDGANGDVARGGQFFRTNCTACHNFAGSGGALPKGKFAPSLIGVSEKHIFEAMLTGPQQMPVFSNGVLTVEDKRAIIGYLNELHDQPNRGGLALGGLGPVAEGLWAWVGGLGVLILFAIWIAAKGVKAR